jgi:hypothetical protein
MSIQNTKQWFDLGVPTPSLDNQRVQLGCHLEEVKEMLDAITITGVDIEELKTALHTVATRLKTDKTIYVVLNDRKEFLDGLADQIVTGTGCAHMFGMDIVGAMDMVNLSNFSKFVDGKPIFNEHGKIAKGPNYFKPDLSQFVGLDPLDKS